MPVPSRIEIPNFPGDKRFAITLSFDDGVIFDRRAVAAFNEWGLKATFNINSGNLLRTGQPAPDSSWYLDASEIDELYRGHEVAIHTVSHPHLPRIDPSQAAMEVLEDRKALEDLVGYPVRGMAYPFGTFNQRTIEILRSLGIVYARTVEMRDPCFPPTEPLAWGATGHQYAEGLLEQWEKRYAHAGAHGVLLIWGHTYEFHQRNDWAGLERIFKPLTGKPDVWYCTNIELFDYEAARLRVVIAANRKSAFNPSALSVTLKLDDRQLVEVPGGKTIALET